MSTPFNIQQRTFNFAVTVVNFCRGLTAAHPVTRRVGCQLLDAATSIGANMEEADAAQSHRDFVAKAAIARKESRETVFWIRLIVATDLRERERLLPLLAEAKEISRIVSAIHRNAQSRH